MSGWGGWGGGAAGSARPPGDPLLSHALITSRGGTLTAPIHPDLSPPRLKTIDFADDLERWEPLVRFNVAMYELTSSTRFGAAGQVATISHTPWADPATPHPIVSIERPATDAEVNKILGAQLQHVVRWARYREDREAEIVAQLAPQTPFWASVANLQPNRHRATLELLDIALAFDASVAMRFKHALALPRPAQYSAKVQPMVPTPEHGTLPSGHGSEAYMAAHVLHGLLISAKQTANAAKLLQQLEALAARIAINRTVAGVHFPIDSVAGRLLGWTLAEYFCYLASGERCVVFKGKPTGWADYAWTIADVDFVPASDRSTVGASHDPLPRKPGGPKQPPAPQPVLNHFWRKAVAEWQ